MTVGLIDSLNPQIEKLFEYGDRGDNPLKYDPSSLITIPFGNLGVRAYRQWVLWHSKGLIMSPLKLRLKATGCFGQDIRPS